MDAGAGVGADDAAAAAKDDDAVAGLMLIRGGGRGGRLAGRHAIKVLNTGGGGLYKLEFLQFKFCTKFLYAICSVSLRIFAYASKVPSAITATISN